MQHFFFFLPLVLALAGAAQLLYQVQLSFPDNNCSSTPWATYAEGEYEPCTPVPCTEQGTGSTMTTCSKTPPPTPPSTYAGFLSYDDDSCGGEGPVLELEYYVLEACMPVVNTSYFLFYTCSFSNTTGNVASYACLDPKCQNCTLNDFLYTGCTVRCDGDCSFEVVCLD
jgi:hypothetical protein